MLRIMIVDDNENTRKLTQAVLKQHGYDTVCAKIPESTKPVGDIRDIELYPYGSAKLRVTEIPKIQK